METQETFTPTSEFPYLKFKFDLFNPVQSEVLKYYDKDINIVVGSNTSSGKTTIAEMIMAHTIEVNKKKAVFLSPLKAVSQEKYDDWNDERHGFSKLNVSIVTGDYKLTEARIEELNKSNIIIMTTEMLDFRTRNLESERNEWLKDVGCVVVDEVHLLCTSRGHSVESALMRFTKKNPTARIILLSATMPNTRQIAEWTSKLNGKKAECIISDYRPCKLFTHYDFYEDKGNYLDIENNKMTKAIEILKKFPDDKFLCFVQTKNAGKSFKQRLDNAGEKAEFHFSEIDLKKRNQITQDFKKDLRIIVATSTLCWGVNLPARRVIILGVHRGLSEIEPLDVIQAKGRSGRTGVDLQGDAHILLPRSRFDHYKKWCEEIPNITSTLNDEGLLAFHIISEINEGEVYDAQSFVKWYNRSLAAFQNDFLDIVEAQDLLNKLEKLKIIKKEDGKFIATNLGKVAASLYLNPYNIAGWYFNFMKIFSMPRYDDTAVCWALANIQDNMSMFVTREYTEAVRKFKNDCYKKGLMINDGPAMMAITYLSCLENSFLVNDYIKAQCKYDLDRKFTALEMIDSRYGMWNKGDFWKKLLMKITYEVSDDMTELCSLKGIGGTRVKKLFDKNIRTIKDFMFFSKEARKIVGDKVYSKVVTENDL